LGFDFVVIDQEHAPFGRLSTDTAILAARAVGIPALVRISEPDAILSVLDCGATGVLVPHVATVEYARKIAAACRYRGGSRGYATSTRAGGYSSTPMWQHIRDSDAMVTLIAQIEDPTAIEEIDGISAVEGIDAVFAGRGDLAAAFGNEEPNPPEVRSATERIAAAALGRGKRFAVFVNNNKDTEWLRQLGANVFVVSSDHGLLRRGAEAALSEIRRHTPPLK
jgi:2-keto-3-deoxy-L-rhamnonate aldolase RhmA